MNPNCRTEVGTTPLILYLLQESQAGQTYEEDPVNLATSYKMLLWSLHTAVYGTKRSSPTRWFIELGIRICRRWDGSRPVPLVQEKLLRHTAVYETKGTIPTLRS